MRTKAEMSALLSGAGFGKASNLWGDVTAHHVKGHLYILVGDHGSLRLVCATANGWMRASASSIPEGLLRLWRDHDLYICADLGPHRSSLLRHKVLDALRAAEADLARIAVADEDGGEAHEARLLVVSVMGRLGQKI